MGKHKKSRSASQKKHHSQRSEIGNSGLLPFLIAAAAMLAVIGLVVALTLSGRGPSGGETAAKPEPSETPETTPTVRLPAASLPMELDGGLSLENLFQFSGINPDSNKREGKDIAAILLKNTSGAYLGKADISVTLTNGKELTFTVTDLPAGKTAMAFSRENASVSAEDACSEAGCSASFEPDLAPIPDQVTVSAAGTTVTVTNRTDRELSNVVVYCRSPLEEEYFGGVAYQYIIENLPAHGTATVDAVDCILGMAEVVRVEINKE